MSNLTEKYLILLFSVLVSICCSIVICKRQLIGHCSVLLLTVMVGGYANAADVPRRVALNSVYAHAGVHAHLATVYSTVIDETEHAWQACKNTQNRAAIRSMLKEHLSIDSLRQDFLDQLDQRINNEHLAQIIGWTQSDAGKKIYQAELESLGLDESRFESLLDTYRQSEIHGNARNIRLEQMLVDTGAVYFLSALNTEISALVSIASVCSASKQALTAAQRQIREDRGAEALYRSFMRNDLLIPTAVIYRNVSNVQLDALGAFSSSDAGDAYYTALIKGVRRVLANKVDRFSETLETTTVSID